MSKEALVEKIAEKLGKTKKESRMIVDAVVDSITEILAEGGVVQIVGFGSFGVRKREAREGRNPATGEKIKIPAMNVPYFRPGKNLKEVVRGSLKKGKKKK